jgi:hypothetical protein
LYLNEKRGDASIVRLQLAGVQLLFREKIVRYRTILALSALPTRRWQLIEKPAD